MGEVSFRKAFVDVGASDKESAEKKTPVGTFGVFHRELVELGNGRILAKALDDRVGVYTLLKTIEKLKGKKLKNTLIFSFTVQEEFSMLGAYTTGTSFKPDLCLAVDITDSDDTREKVHINTVLGAGPAIKVFDMSLISHPGIKKKLVETAKKNKIPYQLEVLPFGGTDAGTISKTGKGVPSAAVSIPTRYIHTPSEVLASDDVDNSVKLLEKFLVKDMKDTV